MKSYQVGFVSLLLRDMNIFERLVSGYPTGDVAPQDFIDRLSVGADDWIGAWIAIALAVIFGLLVYIIPIFLTEKDKIGPYPIWLHTFYFAADSSSTPGCRRRLLNCPCDELTTGLSWIIRL